MTQKGLALSFAFSGYSKTGKTTLFKESKLVLPSDRVLREYDFAFLENPFRDLPHPLQWEANHRKYAVSRAHDGWGIFNDFIRDEWERALLAGKIPIMDGCGLNLVMYATACRNCTPEEDVQVLDMHSDNVFSLIKRRKLEPPFYMMLKATEAMLLEQVQRHNPEIDPDTAIWFVQKEMRILDAYFEKERGQHDPHWIPPHISLDETMANIINYLRIQLRTESIAAA